MKRREERESKTAVKERQVREGLNTECKGRERKRGKTEELRKVLETITGKGRKRREVHDRT